MAHTFYINKRYKLDSPDRMKKLPPEKTLTEAGLTKNQIFIDIGCGTGYFSIPAAKIVGPKGKVFALDTSQEMLDDVKLKIIENDIINIESILTGPYSFNLNEKVGTFAIISNVLHEVEDKEAFLNETYRVLNPKGTLFIIEWKKKETDSGPPLKERLSESEIKKLLEKAKFQLIKSYSLTEDLNAYISKKP